MEEYKNNKIDKLQDLAVDSLISYFEKSKDGDLDKKIKSTARVGLKTLSGVSRLKATERVEKATQLRVVEMVTSNKEQRKEYIRKTLGKEYLPNIDESKKLTEGEK